MPLIERTKSQHVSPRVQYKYLMLGSHMARTLFAAKMMRMLRIACAQELGQLRWSEIETALGKHRERVIARRRFLQMAGAGLPMMPSILASACKTANSSSKEMAALSPKDQGNIVIVGAGAAGLTAAYRLAQANVACTIYEGSERCGGRIYTQSNFNSDGQFCERGGELIDTLHHDLRSLCAELGLSIQEFDEGQGYEVEQWIVGGKDRSDKEIIAAFQPLAQAIIRDTAVLRVNGQIEVPTYNSPLVKNPAVKRLDTLSITEYLESVRCDGWLRDLVDLAYMNMMGSECSDQSALNLLTLVDPDTSKHLRLFGDSDGTKRIVGGNENLTRKLVQVLKGRVPMNLEHRLLAIRDNGRDFVLTFDQRGRSLEVKAERLILAMPFSTLRNVTMTHVVLTPAKARAIKEWGYGTNSKFMMGFRSRPWRTGPRHFSGIIFGDFVAQCFWETSRNQTGKGGIVTNYVSGKRGATPWPSQQVAALKDLDSIFAGSAAEFNGNKLLQHWPTHPLTLGSYTSIKPGQYTTLFGSGGDPELAGRLHFAGEHCSVNSAGYMNGAVQSGNQTAAALLKGPR